MTEARSRMAEPRNRLLARLPEADYRRLWPLLEPVRLATHQVIYESRGEIDYAYFPSSGVMSALTIMLDGTAIEVATVGNEGLIGYACAIGPATSPHKVVVQIVDESMRIAARDFKEVVAWSGPLRDLLTGYHAAFMTQVSQSVACNGLHRLEQRCCRWLLMTHDRVNTDDFRLTHEYLAIMLGARRASVTETFKPLQEAGLVSSVRGRIRIVDRAGLEARVCECYWVVKGEYDRLLSPPSADR